MTPPRTRRHGRVRAQGKLARQQVLHAILIHDQHDQVDGLPANLESEAAPADGEERGRAPALRSAATGDAAAVFCAYDKSALQHRRHYGDALRLAENLGRNSSIRRGLNVI